MSFLIDHITVAGGDLGKLRADLAAAGLATEYGGAHRDGVTEMAIASFSDGSYLELIAPVSGPDRDLASHHVWGPFLRAGAGPCAWAARVPDLAAEAERLRRAGVAVSEPARNGRERPDGVRLEWETVDIGYGPRGSFYPFLIRDLTDRDLRVFPSGKPAADGIAGVSRVVIAVHDLGDAAVRFRQAFGLTESDRHADAQFGAELLALGESVVLAAPLGGSWLGERLRKFGEAPCAFILGGLQGFGSEIRWLDVGWRLGIEAAATERRP